MDYQRYTEMFKFEGPNNIEFQIKGYLDSEMIIPTRCDTKEKLLAFLNIEKRQVLNNKNVRDKYFLQVLVNMQDFESLFEYIRGKNIIYTRSNKSWPEHIKEDKFYEEDELKRNQNKPTVWSAPANNKPITKDEILPFKLVDDVKR